MSFHDLKRNVVFFLDLKFKRVGNAGFIFVFILEDINFVVTDHILINKIGWWNMA